ncbi:MAG TPA: YetF domain-containing protein [Fimbriimonas sp.]|nr:YetF domain-containing protein [Fimbriimonas sp.]
MISLYTASVFAAKTAIVLFWIALLYRVLGKRYVSQWNVYDLVTIVAVSNAVQNAMTGGRGEVLVGIVSAATLLVLAWMLSKLFVRAPLLEKAVVGSPTLLVYEGKLMREHLRREQVSQEELETALHQHGLERIDQIGMAVLEVDGSISIVPEGKSCRFDTDLR